MPATAALPPFVLNESRGKLTLRFEGVSELDYSNCERTGNAMFAALENRIASDIWIDLANIHFLASMALSVFLKLDNHVRTNGGRLTLANLQPDVRKVFTVTRLDQVLAIDGASAGD